MTPEPSGPLPQVGAVLYLDSEIGPNPPDYTGGRHWKLTGSCVLVAPDRILTIGHTLVARREILPAGRYAAFFPYLGLVPIVPVPKEGVEWEPRQKDGDNLALATLDEPVKNWPPLHPFYEKGWKKGLDDTSDALVCGYGSWRNGGLPFEGLQHQRRVQLGSQKLSDNLDLIWSSSRNGDLAASRGNSGGPLLWSGEHRVVGINREVAGDREISSWITRDRMKWLKPLSTPLGPDQISEPLKLEWKPLKLTPEEGQECRFEVPQNARQIRATLNASPGLRLRMEITPDLSKAPTSTGRFLCREAGLMEDTREVIVRVDRAPRSPYQVGTQVLAELCVLFK